MMKILLVSLKSCYPLHHGGAIAQYYFIDGLKHEIEFVLCTQISNKKEHDAIKKLQTKQPNLKIYYLNNNANQKNIRKLVRYFANIFIKIIKRISNNEYPDDFSTKHNISSDCCYSEDFIKLLNHIIRTEHITQIQFDFYETINLSFAVPDEIRKIFVHHEIRFKRLLLFGQKSRSSSEYKQFLINKTKLIETNFLKKMDTVIVFNDDDAALLTNDCKHIVISPFGIPDELVSKNFESKNFEKFLFVGGEGHNPNKLGLTWFLDEIYIPNITGVNYPILIIGNWSKKYRGKYRRYSKILFCGIVDSIEPFFENSIFINPILTGSGIRTKVLHAFANKVPVLSTRFGAEGCYDKFNKDHLLFFDSFYEFVNIINKNPDYERLALAGFNYYNDKFNKDILLQKRLNVYLTK